MGARLLERHQAKLLLIAGLMTRADLLLLDEPNQRTRSPYGAGVPAIHCGLQRAQADHISVLASSEIEAVCDRIAILRAGELVETGAFAEMRHLSVLSIEAEFDGAPPDIARIPGVSAVATLGNRPQCLVTGPVEPLLMALAGWGDRNSPRRSKTILASLHWSAGRIGSTRSQDVWTGGSAL